MTMRVGLAFLTIVSLTACAPDVEGAASDAISQALARGTESTNESAVILAGPFACSAVVIGPRVVLSARHCVIDTATGKVDDAVPFSVRLGPLRNDPEIELPVREVRVPVEQPMTGANGTDFLIDMNGRDLAVALLDEDLPVAPASIVRAAPEQPIGMELTVVGYGLTGDAALPAGVRRETTAIVTDNSGVLLAIADSPLCAGDSGGPAFNEDGELVGVHSSGAGTQDRCGETSATVNGVWGDLPFLDRALNSSEACPSGDLEACAADDAGDPPPAVDPGPDPGGCGTGAAALLFFLPLVRLRRRLRALHALPLLVGALFVTSCAGADASEGEGEGEGEGELVSYGLRDCPADAFDSLLGNANVAGFNIFGRVDAPAGVPLIKVRHRTVWGPNDVCRCDAPHRVSVFRSFALAPEEDPERVFAKDVPGVECNMVGEVVVDLDEPLILDEGEVAYVAVEMTGTAVELTCVASCVGPDIESGWGSTSEPPFAYEELLFSDGVQHMAPRFELLGAP